MSVYVCLCVYMYVIGMTKVEEKLKAGRAKRSEGSGYAEENQRRPPSVQPSKKDSATTSSGEYTDHRF